jgi:hypothetical protein
MAPHALHVPVPDTAKLILLVAFVSFCLSSLWTSNSSKLLGNQQLPTLRPANDFCGALRTDASSCVTVNTGSCVDKKTKLRTCENSVQQAFRHINFQGCSQQNLANAVCELKWCIGQASDPIKCNEKCELKRRALEECINAVVQMYQRRFGLQEQAVVVNGK